MLRRKRKPRYFLRFIQISSLVIFLSLLILGHQVTRPLDFSDSIYLLKPGQTTQDLAKLLVSDGIISNAALFVWVARLGNFDRHLKAGEYKFDSDFNILDVLDHIVAGISVHNPVRFIEGWTFKDYLNELKTKANLEYTLESVPYDEIMNTLGIPQQHPEGWFFPDTYFYNVGQSDSVILLNAYEAMQKKLQEEWSNRNPNLPYDSAYEALIVASIVEKETGVPSEYPIVAGVVVNRLRQGMRLQMDPTVIYGLEEFEGTLLRSHLDTDTPYNTYTRHGLPPTPIAMPGLLAIRAASQPAETEALYFVSRGDGTHQFSNTLDEHLKAVREYRRLKNKKS